MVASMYYHERNYSPAATEGVWQRVYDRKIGEYLAAGQPKVVEVANRSPMTYDEHDAAVFEVWDTEMSLLEATR